MKSNMANQTLRELLAGAGERMASSLREQLVPHRGEQGMAREEIIRKFLRAYLPKRFEVSSGFIFDAEGNLSGQTDIIIADAYTSACFEVDGGIRLYPCESVVAAGEIKTNITSRKELWDSMSTLRNIGLLDRSANGRSVCRSTGEPIDHVNNHLHRIFTFLFIIERALSVELAQEVLIGFVHRSEPHVWPNLIMAFDKYLLTYCCNDGVCPNTMDARGIASVTSDKKIDVFLKFYIYLSQAIATISVSQMSAWAYLGDLVKTPADVSYNSILEDDGSPPFLHKSPSIPWSVPDFQDCESVEP